MKLPTSQKPKQKEQENNFLRKGMCLTLSRKGLNTCVLVMMNEILPTIKANIKVSNIRPHTEPQASA